MSRELAEEGARRAQSKRTCALRWPYGEIIVLMSVGALAVSASLSADDSASGVDAK